MDTETIKLIINLSHRSPAEVSAGLKDLSHNEALKLQKILVKFLLEFRAAKKKLTP